MTTLRAPALALLLTTLAAPLLAPPVAAQESTPPAAPSPAPSPSPSPSETPAQTPAETPAESPATPATPADPAATADPAVPAATADPAVPAEAEKKPQLTVTEPVRDLGRVRRGEKIEVVYELVNSGDARLEIRSADPSCGCTVASYDRKIEPGGKGELRAVIDTEALEGALAKGITVVSNDPVQPRLVLTMKFEVLADVRVTPAFARLLQVQSMPPAKSAVHLWTVDGPPLELGAIETGAPWIQASARRAGEAERRSEGPPEQWLLEVTLAPEAPLGPLTQSVVVASNHPRQPRIEIPLSGFVRPVLSTQPTVADFGSLGRTADPKQFVVKLFNFGGEPVEVTSATTDLAFVRVTVEPDEPGRRFRLRLALDPEAPKGKFEGTLKVATTSATLPALEIPVRGRVQ